jgi:DNA-binding CsgD family transcriptional regulator
LLKLGNPADSLRLCQRELQLRRERRPAAFTRDLHAQEARILLANGQLARARGVLGGMADNDPSIAYAEGEWDWAQTLNDDRIARFVEAGDRLNEVEVRELAARIAFARLDWGAAERELSAMLALVDGRGVLFWEGPLCARLAVTSARLGRIEVAHSHADRCQGLLTNGENWYGQSGALHLAQAVVCGVEGRLADAEVRFGEAVQTFQRFGLPWLEAETLEHWAYVLNLHGRTARAGPIAEAAASVYQRIGAGAPWIKRVARAVQPVVVREPGPPNGLTLRQADVLRRLADGQTNSEIAQELVVSTRTVERHIETIYAKIGASGPTARAQAAAYAYRHRLVGPTTEG